MTDIGTHDAVAGYLASVRAALSDLPDAEIGEILDDVGPHVTEVAQELLEETGSPDDDRLAARLRERLGDPERYAAELRAAADYPPRPTVQPEAGRPSTLLPRLSLWLLAAATVAPAFAAVQNGPDAVLALLFLALLAAAGSLLIAVRLPGGVAGLATLPELRWLHTTRPSEGVRQYARLLQHGWWLVRAGVAALLFLVVFGLGRAVLPLALLVVVFAIGSGWLGLRSQADRRWLWAVLPLNVFALALAVLVLYRFDLDGGGSRVVYVPTDGPGQFRNIYPYDSSGRPLSGVLLYDESGRPVAVQPGSFDECLPSGGVPVPANQYPQPVYVYGSDGRCLPAPSAQPTPAPSPPPAISTPAPTTSPVSAPPLSTPAVSTPAGPTS